MSPVGSSHPSPFDDGIVGVVAVVELVADDPPSSLHELTTNRPTTTRLTATAFTDIRFMLAGSSVGRSRNRPARRRPRRSGTQGCHASGSTRPRRTVRGPVVT